MKIVKDKGNNEKIQAEDDWKAEAWKIILLHLWDFHVPSAYAINVHI